MELAKAVELILSVLFFPNFNMFLQFAWGAGDPLWILALKRIFLVLPVLAIILGYWMSIVSLLTVVIRADRQAYVNAIVVTWWDLGRAIFSFWGGTFKFVFSLTLALFGIVRMAIVGLWVLVQDLLLIPFRVAANLSQNFLNPGVPWVAVGLTLFWCVLEAIIFTYVCSPLVLDTLSNMTGGEMSETLIRIPLFMFMLFIVLGSYAVLSTWTTSLRTKDVGAIVKIGAIEAVALFVEVVFLYREFVDALVPWFAQHASGNFELGVFGTLAIAGVTWFGIRGMSWFLFASSGTPTIMAIIRGSGLEMVRREHASAVHGSFQLVGNLIGQIKSEMEWIQAKGEEVLGNFIIPPLQVVASAINFCTLLITKQHLFKLPFRHVNDLRAVRTLLNRVETTNRQSADRPIPIRKKAA